MGFGFLVTKALSGLAVAEKSQRRQLEKKYSQTAEDLKNASEVSRELPIPVSVASSITSCSSYTDPLQTRLPKEGTLRPPRLRLERSKSALCTRDRMPSNVQDFIHPSNLTSQAKPPTMIKRNYSFTKVWERETQNRRGIGRYTMSRNAEPEHQLNHLHRAMSDLTPQMVRQLDDFHYSGTDPEIWHEYKKSRTESTASSTSSQSSANRISSSEKFDSRRGVNVVRGFAPSIISSTSSSAGDEQSLHYRKDSVLSMTSVSSDGEVRSQRRKSRQASLPVSDNSTGSPLTTITENPDATDKPQRKLERPCEFDEITNNDSALASDASDDEGAWMPEITLEGKLSRLSKQVERNRKAPNGVQHLARARARSNDRPKAHQSTKLTVNRSKTVKHAVRPSVRRTQSHKHKKSRPTANSAPKGNDTKEDHSKDEGPETQADVPAVSTGSDEAGENPTDLSLYMEKVRSKHSSKGENPETRESEDDNASINSESTVKTFVPAMKKMVEAIPIHRRKRSATAFRIPLPTCQPPKKGEKSKPEPSQTTAH